MRTTTGISLPPALKQAAERQAKREHRSLSSLINFALAQYLREVGVWEDEEPEDELSRPERGRHRRDHRARRHVGEAEARLDGEEEEEAVRRGFGQNSA